MKDSTLNYKSIYNNYEKVLKHFKYKNFEEFNYIEYKPTEKEVVINFIIALVISILTLIITVKIKQQ